MWSCSSSVLCSSSFMENPFELMQEGNWGPEQKQGRAPTRYSQCGDEQSPNGLHHEAGSDTQPPKRQTLRSVRTGGLDWKPFGETDHCSINKFMSNYTQKYNVNNILKLENSWRSRKSHISSRRQSTASSTTSLVSLSCSSGGCTQDTQRFSSSPRYRRCFTSKTCIRIISRVRSSSCHFTTILSGNRNATKSANTIQLVLHPTPIFLEGRGTFLGPGDEAKWYGSVSYKPHGQWNTAAGNMTNKFAERQSSWKRQVRVESTLVLVTRSMPNEKVRSETTPKFDQFTTRWSQDSKVNTALKCW